MENEKMDKKEQEKQSFSLKADEVDLKNKKSFVKDWTAIGIPQKFELRLGYKGEKLEPDMILVLWRTSQLEPTDEVPIFGMKLDYGIPKDSIIYGLEFASFRELHQTHKFLDQINCEQCEQQLTPICALDKKADNGIHYQKRAVPCYRDLMMNALEKEMQRRTEDSG